MGYFEHCAKKGRYAVGLGEFLAKHGRDGRNIILDRPYLRRPWTLLGHPVLGTGLLVLKGGEVVAVVSGLLRHRLSREHCRHGAPPPTHMGDCEEP